MLIISVGAAIRFTNWLILEPPFILISILKIMDAVFKCLKCWLLQLPEFSLLNIFMRHGNSHDSGKDSQSHQRNKHRIPVNPSAPHHRCVLTCNICTTLRQLSCCRTHRTHTLCVSYSLSHQSGGSCSTTGFCVCQVFCSSSCCFENSINFSFTSFTRLSG